MALDPGTRIGPYELVAAIGAGGMGEVYRARDTRLGRDVAIKVLPDAVAADRDRLARFEREATVLASLNHPNIAHVYGLETEGAISALVMELVDGDDLSLRIALGPTPPDQVIAVALQLCDALAAAHERGIVHRDLKPANIKLRRDGVVKVLDFGLAKAASANAAGDVTATRHDLTARGEIVGTAAYMSPEQVAGDAVDARTDVWAFGCVLFELLAGRKPFKASSNVDLFSAVLTADPDWSRIASAPPRLQSLIRRCLHKDRAKRLGNIGDARLWLEDVGGIAAPLDRRPGRARWMAIAASLMAIAAIAVSAWSIWGRRDAPAQLMRLQIDLDAYPLSGRPSGINVVLSPDGRTLIYHALSADIYQLVRRSVDSLDETPIPGTDRAQNPAISPDSTRIAFYSRGAIRIVPLSGGTPIFVCEVKGRVPFIAWPEGGSIYFAQQELWRVAETGGEPEVVAKPAAGEATFFGASALPDGAVALSVLAAPNSNRSARAVAYSPATGLKTLIEDSGPVVYSAGHLVFSHQRELRAARFDARRLAITGTPFTIAGLTNQVTASNDGTIVYVAPGDESPGRFSLHLLSHDGRLERALVDDLAQPRHTRLSPDGHSLAVVTGDLNGGEIWRFDLRSRAQPIKITFRRGANFPVWSPDGRDVYFQRLGLEPGGLASTKADGSVINPDLLFTGDGTIPEDWTPDGRSMIYQVTNARSGNDLMLFDNRARASSPWLQTPFNEAEARLDPTGRWVAYVSDQTGRAEVWIRPFAGSAAPVRVSAGGGHEPRWSADGKTIYFSNGDRMMAAGISLTPTVEVSAPRQLFQGGFIPYNATYRRTYDVTPDGRFIVAHTDSVEQHQPLVVILNAFSGRR